MTLRGRHADRPRDAPAPGARLFSGRDGYTGPTYYNGSVFVPTYNRVLTTPSSGEVKTFNPLAGSHFLFPYHSGDIRTHLLSALSQGNETYNSEIQYDAQTSLPAPHARNIFTYLGGMVSAPTTALATQSGWTPVNFDVTSIQSPVSTCHDSLSIGQVAANTTTDKPGPYLGMVSGADGVCDLEESLAQGLVLNASMFGSDYGSSEWTSNKAALLSTANGGAVQGVEGLIQMVRGFCYARPRRKMAPGPWSSLPPARNATTMRRPTQRRSEASCTHRLPWCRRAPT